HETLGDFRFHADSPDCPAKEVHWLFTENETDYRRIFGIDGPTPYVKDAFHRYVVEGEKDAVSPLPMGTKSAALFHFVIPPGGSVTIRCRLHAATETNGFDGLDGFGETFAARIEECDRFYGEVIPKGLSSEEYLICRQGYAGLL